MNRIEKLKKALTSKDPTLCLERAKLATESYKQTDGESPVARRAKAFASVLNNVPIFIEEDELIVGNTASKPMSVEVKGTFPPFMVNVRRKEGWKISEQDEKDLQSIHEYWVGRTIWDMMDKAFFDDDAMWRYSKSGLFTPVAKEKVLGVIPMAGTGWDLGRQTGCIPDYEKVLNKGLASLIEEAKEELKNTKVTSAKNYEKISFLKAAIISLEAIINYANRFSAKAAEMAKKEKNVTRKKELEHIAEACQWIPANPARNFYEAIQSYWFIVLMVPGSSAFFGRLDQILYPFYKQDKETGITNEDEVLELLQCLRIKTMQLHPLEADCRRIEGAQGSWGGLVIGGVKSDGRDATNELTYLFLEASKLCPTSYPQTFLRVHENTPDALMMKAMEVLKSGVNMPSFLGDPNSIDFLLNNGVPINIARDYSVTACLETSPMGRSRFVFASQFNMALILEYFLNNGVEPKTGDQYGPRIEVEKIRSFDELMKAFKESVEFFIRIGLDNRNIASGIQREHFPDPPASALSFNGIKEGNDVFYRVMPLENGVAMNYCYVVNVADSLAAIKKLVFDEKKFTMKKLQNALAANWKGYENMRQMCLNSPKFGNDDDYVDLIAKDVFQFLAETTVKYDTVFGGKAKPVSVVLSRYRTSEGAQFVGATPDGRYKSEALADESLSPMVGMDTHGPWAVINSALKIDQALYHSMTLGMNFDSAVLKTKEGMKQLSDFIKTYIMRGGRYLQLNVVSKDKLQEAQKNPDKHQELIVNMSSDHWAYFVQCAKDVQDRLIQRTTYKEL